MSALLRIGIRTMCVAGLVFAAYLTGPARAADIDGAWANNPDLCKKIFVKKGNKVSMTRNSDFFGSGFIIDGKHLRGKMASCEVKARKDDGAMINIVAACSTDIAVATNQFSLRVDGDGKLTRFFPGMPDMDMSYFRCPL